MSEQPVYVQWIDKHFGAIVDVLQRVAAHVGKRGDIMVDKIKINMDEFKKWRDAHVDVEMERMKQQLDNKLPMNDADVISLFMRVVMTDVLAFMREQERVESKSPA